MICKVRPEPGETIIPQCSTFCSRISWFTVSKAFSRSMKIPQPIMFVFNACLDCFDNFYSE